MRISQLITRNVQVAAHLPATVSATRTVSWAEHADRVSRLAGALHDLGIGDGDSVAMLALNSDRYLEWFLGTSWAGAVFVPINTRLALPEIVHWLNDSGTTVLFVDDTFMPMVPALRTKTALRHVVHVGEGPPASTTLDYEQLVASAGPVEPSERGGDDLAGLFYTGGTTGQSKGVMLSHDNLLANAWHILPPLRYSTASVYLHAAPMFHLANGLGMFLAALTGARSVFVPSFTPDSVLNAIVTHRVTDTVMVPTMISALAHRARMARFDLGSWRTLLYGGSPISDATIASIQEVAPELQLIQTYGQTEASPVVTMLGPEHHTLTGSTSDRTRSAGQAVYGVELSIMDPDGRKLPSGHVGEICARGDNVMIGYLNRPEETRTALRDDWLHTGDAGYLDEDGFLYVVDRIKDMIISGGENVYSSEVENALAQHPAVRECVVFGIPSDKWGEQVHAVVTVDHPIEGETLREHCKQLIANYKCPRSIDIRTEPLPKSGAGKILKRELRAPYWEGREQHIQ